MPTEAVPSGEREGLPIGPGPFPGIRRPLRSLVWLIQVIVGLVFLVGLLAVLAAIPGLSLLTLGYLLTAEARVGRTGQLRTGFPLLAVSARIGMILLAVTIFLIPVQILAVQSAARGIIVDGSPLSPGRLLTITRTLQTILFFHLLLAIANGGSFSCFFRPIRNLKRLVRGLRNGDYAASVNVWTNRLLDIFQPWETIKTAVRGAVGAFLWLVIPTALLATSTTPQQNPGPALLATLIGGILLIPVAAWLPLLQAHQAVTGRFSAIFDVRAARQVINRVPLRWLIATTLLYALALPLYFTKIRLPANDAMWLVTPLFVLLTYPTRILMGWVYGTGKRKSGNAWFGIRWTAKLVMIPLLAIYAAMLFATPLISEVGRAAIFENHAFLLPVPVGKLLGG
ncbi:MAG: hypothetical protein R3C19_05705 [Planctomycetaceae bacterium]